VPDYGLKIIKLQQSMSEEQKIQVHTKTGMFYTTCYKPLFEREKSNPISEVVRLDNMEFMAAFPDKFFDLAIVDPPYGINLKGENLIVNPNDHRNHKHKKEVTWDAEIPNEEYFNALFRVSKEQIIWGGNHFLDILGYCKAPIIWDKLNGDSMYADGEMAWTSKGLPKNLKIWKHQWCGAFKDSERGALKYHPTQKPIALYKWLLSKYAKEGQKILDTHLGSQSSRVAAWEMGFDFWGCEIDEQYFKDGCKRFEAESAQTALWVG